MALLAPAIGAPFSTCLRALPSPERLPLGCLEDVCQIPFLIVLDSVHAPETRYLCCHSPLPGNSERRSLLKICSPSKDSAAPYGMSSPTAFGRKSNRCTSSASHSHISGKVTRGRPVWSAARRLASS